MRKRYLLLNAADDQGSGNQGTNDNSDSGNQKDQDSGDQGQKGEKDKDSGNPDLNSLPEWAQKELKSLRGESAKYRTDNKGLKDRLDNFEKNLKKVLGGEEEGDDEAPEVKIEKLQGHAQSLEVKTAFMEIAIENSISKAEYEYFEFLMGKALNGLKEDEELTEEALEAIISKCKTQEKKPADSSVNNGQDGKGQKKDSSISVEEFAKMSVTQKSELFQKNRELYNSLFEQAKNKRLI